MCTNLNLTELMLLRRKHVSMQRIRSCTLRLREQQLLFLTLDENNNNKKAFQSNANRPLVNRMFFIINTFEDVQGQGLYRGLGKAGGLGRSLRGRGSLYCEVQCIKGKWVMVTWDPCLGKQTNMTKNITLRQLRFRIVRTPMIKRKIFMDVLFAALTPRH